MKNQISVVIEPRAKDVGIPVRRILPWAKRRMVGPFIFLDHMGPALMKPPKDQMDVRPHPHIGLSTLTYLFSGQIFHRDSLGVEQLIVPGEVNWMTAGSGISHSEREPQNMRQLEREIHGLQFWVALPVESEDVAPSFHHYEKGSIPFESTPSHDISIIAGTRNGKTSPLKAYGPMTFQVVKAKTSGVFHYSRSEFELGVYLVEGSINIEGRDYAGNQMLVFEKGSEIELTHSPDALFTIIGGTPLPEPRFIWWNFVSSSQDKIEQAKRAWKSGTFPQVPGDPERIPLPVN